MISLGEPKATAIALVGAGVLMTLSVLFSRATARIGVPIPLIFLALGMLAGEEGLGGISFNDYGFTFRLGTVALVLILFDGGLNTPMSAIRMGVKPASMLATFGVAVTAALIAVPAHFFGFSWEEGFLLGAVVSSTDAAVVFSVLRNSGVNIKKSLLSVLEMESGLNDPMAVILTVALTQNLFHDKPVGWHTLLEVPLEIGVGAALGLGIGFGGRHLLSKARLPSGGLYPIMTLALACLAFGVPTLFHGSGFLAVYVTSVILGNGAIPYRSSLLHVHNSVAWFSQIVMFLLLGMLVFPSQLIEVAPAGLGIGLFLTFVARPLAVFLSLAPFRYALKDMTYISWVGLRGAVPIILATFPVLAHGEHAQRLFDVVFFVVVVNALVPGGTVPRVTRWLGLELKQPPPAPAVLEINATQLLAGDVMSFYIEPSTLASETPIADLPFPPASAVLLAVRGDELIAPKGHTVLKPGDHVYVFCRPKDKQLIQMMFGTDTKDLAEA
jgi:cell volume regulation protein A